MLKELQSLGLDVRVYDENQNEVEIMESVDYSESDFRAEMDGDAKYDYNKESFDGYQKKEFDAASGDLVDSYDEEEEAMDDDFADDFDDMSDSYED